MSKLRDGRAADAELDAIDPEIARLFAATSFPEPPADVRARVFGRAAHTIAAASIGAGVAASLLKAIQAHSLRVAMATFALGGIVGATAVVVFHPVAAPVVTPVPPPEGSVAPPPSAVAPSGSATIEPAPPSSVKRGGQPLSSASSGDTLRAERAIIDDARSKLAAGETGAALVRLEEHARRFPKARLEEEREALSIQALANMGGHRDARARAKVFHERWPTSVYGPAVDATLESIP